MARLLAIDYGLKRVGLAVTDPLQVIAVPLEVVHPKDLITYIKNYTLNNPIEAFVVGFPSRLDNSDTDLTPVVRKFARELEKNFAGIPVFLHDERFTTVMAQDSMIRGGVKKKNRRNKSIIDKISATILLQSFMEQKNKP